MKVLILLAVLSNSYAVDKIDAALIYKCEINIQESNLHCVKYCMLVDDTRAYDVLHICEDDQVHSDYKGRY